MLYSVNQRQEVELAQLRAEHQEQEKPQEAKTDNGTQSENANEELTRLRKENEGLLRLRNEVRQLREENQKLTKQAQGVQASAKGQPSQQDMQQLLVENQQLKAQSLQIQQSGQANSCINNLRQIEGAKQQWALENQRPAGGLVGPTDIAAYFPNKTVPVCPAGGVYTLNPVSISPICSVPGHVLPK
jgi:hypothetical protein